MCHAPAAVVAMLPMLVGYGRIAFDPRDDGSVDGLPADHVLYLPFDQPDLLAEPHGHVPACTACPTPGAGVHGGAASFDGASCLVIADAPELRPAQATIALWAHTDVIADASMFSRPFSGMTGGANTWELITLQSTDWKIGINSMYAGRPQTFGAWHHLVVAVDDQMIVRYFDGEPLVGTPVGPIAYGADDLRVGCDLNGNVEGFFFTGLIDEVRVYARVLSAQEIETLAQ